MDTDRRFSERFASWRMILASLPAGDIEGASMVFDNAIKDIAGYVAEGLDKVQGVDELHNMAQTHGLLGHLGEDDVQARIARGFEHVETPASIKYDACVAIVPDDWGEPQGEQDAPPKGNGQQEGGERQTNGQTAKRAEPIGFLDEWDAGDDPGPIPPRQWLLGNQFCRGFVSSVVAAGGGGKTALRVVQFISLATGKPLCGQHIFRRCRVLLISLEDNRDEMNRRIKAVLDHFGIDRSELKGWLFVACPKGKLAEMKNRIRSIGPLERQIRDAVERRKPDIIGLDPFVKTHGLEENDSGDMDFVCSLLVRLASEFNIAVDSPHHVHKGTIVPGDPDSGRGSSGIKDAGRLVHTLAPMSEAEAASFGNIAPEDRCTYVRLDPAKLNIAPRAGAASWFHLVGVPIGNGTPEYPNGDTVQVAVPWKPPSAWADTTSFGLNAILTEIDHGMTAEDGNPTGRRYSNAPAARDRAAWPVVQRHHPDKPEAACREIIHAWLASGLLYPKDYDDPVQRRPQKGLFVDSTKRPA